MAISHGGKNCIMCFTGIKCEAAVKVAVVEKYLAIKFQTLVFPRERAILSLESLYCCSNIGKTLVNKFSTYSSNHSVDYLHYDMSQDGLANNLQHSRVLYYVK